MTITVLDNMEYGSDAAAQSGYQSNYVGGVDVLVVAGGGGGGYDGNSGGGGGGGVIYSLAHAVSVGDYSVSVGDGGAGGTSSGNATNGEDSTFDDLTAIGGGRGGDGNPSSVGSNGGCGGGGGCYLAKYGGSGTNGQGYAGGIGSNNAAPSYAAGGGGGAGEVGAAGTSSGSSGTGGDGISCNLSGTSVYYGGGGGAGQNVIPSPGGLGGGGNGGCYLVSAATDGTQNTGGGGGGGTNVNPSRVGGDGGSGIVIISYVTGHISATGGSVTTNGGKTIHTFTDSGTFSVSSAPFAGVKSYSEPTTITEGSYSLKGIAAQTTSLNKALTRTISSPINLTSHAYIIGKIRASRTGSNIKIGFHDLIGPTVLTGGTVSADSWYSGDYQPAYGCDSNLSTRWQTGYVGLPTNWKYDLGSGVTKTVTVLSIIQWDGAGTKDFVLSGSNDDSTYNTIYTGSVPTGYDGKPYYCPFTNTTAYRYYKITINNNHANSNYVGFTELILSETNGLTTEVTPNVTAADTWQTIQLDISAVSDANKDAIDQIIITVVNADADNTFYLDNFFAVTAADYAAGMQVSKAVGYAVLYPIANAMNVSKIVAYAVLGPYVEPSDGGPMMWIF